MNDDSGDLRRCRRAAGSAHWIAASGAHRAAVFTSCTVVNFAPHDGASSSGVRNGSGTANVCARPAVATASRSFTQTLRSTRCTAGGQKPTRALTLLLNATDTTAEVFPCQLDASFPSSAPAAKGVIAQLVERLNGIEEVWGSNPHGSTFQAARQGDGVVHVSVNPMCRR